MKRIRINSAKAAQKPSPRVLRTMAKDIVAAAVENADYAVEDLSRFLPEGLTMSVYDTPEDVLTESGVEDLHKYIYQYRQAMLKAIGR